MTLLTSAENAHPAGWVVEGVHDGAPVGWLIPGGLPSHFRLFHPAFLGNGAESSVCWREVGAAMGNERGQVFLVPHGCCELLSRLLGRVCADCVPIVPHRGRMQRRTSTVGHLSRPPRIEIPGGVYHVVARGNERKSVYRDRVDHARFLETLRGTADRHAWRVLAYCLMSNHYHLLVSTPNANLARGMRDLNGVYAQAFNRRHGRDGHLFQGRYKAVLVQADEHLFAVFRYIIRNPVRAGLTEHVGQWPWTSHAATIGRTPPGFLAIDQLLSYFARDRATARQRYLALLDSEPEGLGAEHPIVAGDGAFVARELRRIRPSPEHPRDQITPVPLALSELLSTSGDLAAIAYAHQTGYSMRQIATHLGCGVTTIHRRIREHEQASGTRKT